MRILGRCVLAASLLALGAAPVAAQADANLNTRVYIDFKDARAIDVLKAIAISASLGFETAGEELSSPVTITLNDVRVRTALDAVCENAGCKWSVVDGKPPVLKVSRTGRATRLELKGDISVHLKSALFEQAFKSLASYLDVAVVIEGKLPVKSVTISLKEGTTSTLLDALCKAASCTWRFEPESKRLVISAKQ